MQQTRFGLLLGIISILSGCSSVQFHEDARNMRLVKMYDLHQHYNGQCVFDNSRYAREIAKPDYKIFDQSLEAKASRVRTISNAYYQSLKKLSSKYHLFNMPTNRQYSLAAVSNLHKKYSYLPLLLPLSNPRLGSKFHEYRKFSNKRAYYHKGIDLIGAKNAEIYAAGDGMVIFSGRQNGYGKVIIIEHSSHIKTLYAHLSSLQAHKGQQVVRGQIIGRQGASGNACGAHLHFEILVKGRAVEPLDFIGTFCKINPSPSNKTLTPRATKR